MEAELETYFDSQCVDPKYQSPFGGSNPSHNGNSVKRLTFEQVKMFLASCGGVGSHSNETYDVMEMGINLFALHKVAPQGAQKQLLTHIAPCLCP